MQIIKPLPPIAQRPFFKRYGLIISVVGVILVLTANGLLVYFALSTWTGFETEQSYVKGIHYNDNLDGASKQNALGWALTMATTFDPPSNEGQVSGMVEVRIARADGAALTGLEVRLDAIRPTHDGYDRSVTLTNQGGGVYGGRIDLPLRGQWDFRVQARAGGDDFQQIERIITP